MCYMCYSVEVFTVARCGIMLCRLGLHVDVCTPHALPFMLAVGCQLFSFSVLCGDVFLDTV